MHFLKEARNRWTLGHDMFVGVIDPAVSKFFLPPYRGLHAPRQLEKVVLRICMHLHI